MGVLSMKTLPMLAMFVILITQNAKSIEAPINNCQSMLSTTQFVENDTLTYDFFFNNTDFQGTLAINTKDSRLIFSSPQAFNHNFSSSEDEIEFFNFAIECLLDKIAFQTLQIETVLVDFFPKFHICKSLKYYADNDNTIELTRENIPTNAIDPRLKKLVEFSQDAGFFLEWDYIFSKFNYRLESISEAWIEVAVFENLGKVFIKENGHIKYCNLSDEQKTNLKTNNKNNVIPIKLRKFEFKISGLF